VDQPENDPNALWRFLPDGTGLRFSQTVPNSGQDAFAIGPVFWVSTPCSGSQVQVQVKHIGEITGAIPHVKVRALDSLNWIDLGSLPPHKNDYPAARISTFSTPLGFLAPKFQVAIHSNLSAVPPCCTVELHNIRVDTGEAPSWKKEFDEITIPAGITSTYEIFATDPDGDQLYFHDVTDSSNTGLESLYSIEAPITNDANEQGLRITFISPPASTFKLALEVRDQDGQQGLAQRSFLTVNVEASSACGNLILEDGEECDLGSTPPAELCSLCLAPEIDVSSGPFGSIFGADVSRFPVLGSGRLVTAWKVGHPDFTQEVLFRVLETNVTSPSGSIFLTDSITATLSPTDADIYNVSTAALSQSLLAVTWEEHDGDEQDIRYRVFNEQGNSVAGATTFTPYPSAASAAHNRQPTPVRVDGTRLGFAWVEDVADTTNPNITRGRLVTNVISIPAQLAIPGNPVVLWDDPLYSVKSVDVVKRNANELWLVWDEVALGDGTTRIRTMAIDASSFQTTLPESIIADTVSGVVGSPSIAALSDGSLFVTWEHIGVDSNSILGSNIQVRILTASGSSATSAVTLENPDTSNGPMDRPNVSVNGQGEVLLSWFASTGIASKLGGYEAGDDAAGWLAKTTEVIQLNLSQSDETSRARSVGMNDGRFGVIWTRRLGLSQDKVHLRAVRPIPNQP